jgi:hypothetical protein
MHRIEPQRLPEEVPGPLDPIGLQDLVEAVGEMVEPIKADRRGERGDETEKAEVSLADGGILSDK